MAFYPLYSHTTYQNLRTQKARGIATLARASIPSGYFKQYLCRDAMQYKSDGIPGHLTGKITFERPLFARPCPLRPRHGFVESRIVRSMQDLEFVMNSALLHDSFAEVVVMSPYPADWSAIVTEDSVVFGPGTDGATSGRGSMMLPALTSRELIGVAYGADMKELMPNGMFLEILGKSRGRNREIVQMRDGPRISGASAARDGYIPRDMTVQYVLVATGDLIEFEERVKNLRRMEKFDVAVWHPGGSISSHYAIHAISHGFAVLWAGEQPRLGQRLEKNIDIPLSARMTDDEVQFLATEIKTRFKTVAPDPFNSFDPYTAIAAVHASILWPNDRPFLALRAHALVLFAKLIGGICAGELRHYNDTLPEEIQDLAQFQAREQSESRNRIYLGAAELGLREHIRLSELGVDMFGRGSSCWSSGFGGRPWQIASETQARLLSAIKQFITTPSNETWLETLAQWNALTSIAHNGGLLFNKLMPTRLLVNAADVAGMMLCNPGVYQVLRENA